MTMSDQAEFLDLYAALLDWLTLTSFEKEFYNYWESRLNKLDAAPTPWKWRQYEGRQHSIQGGTGQIGVSFQKGVYHYIVRLTGHAAELNKEPAFSQRRQAYVSATRLDLQITIPMIAKWSQKELLWRLQHAGKLTGWKESRIKGVGYQTVYVGARESDRYVRVYIKTAGDTKLLRLEVEYKKPRADQIFKQLAGGNRSPAQYLSWELQNTLDDEPLRHLFEPSLYGAKPLTDRIKVKSSLEKQEQWLLSQVYPAFTMHINDHGASGRVLAAFWQACKDAIEREENE